MAFFCPARASSSARIRATTRSYTARRCATKPGSSFLTAPPAASGHVTADLPSSPPRRIRIGPPGRVVRRPGSEQRAGMHPEMWDLLCAWRWGVRWEEVHDWRVMTPMRKTMPRTSGRAMVAPREREGPPGSRSIPKLILQKSFFLFADLFTWSPVNHGPLSHAPSNRSPCLRTGDAFLCPFTPLRARGRPSDATLKATTHEGGQDVYLAGPPGSSKRTALHRRRRGWCAAGKVLVRLTSHSLAQYVHIEPLEDCGHEPLALAAACCG